MFKKLFSDTIIYTLPTISNRLLGIVFFIFLARYLGPKDFASIELLSLMLIFINRIISLEINRGFGREITDKSDVEISKFISTTFSFLFLGYLCFSLIALSLPIAVFDTLLNIQADSIFFGLFLLYIFSNSFLLMTLEIFRWSMFSLSYSMLSLASVFLGSFLSFIFIFYLDLNLIGYILGQTFSQLLLLIIGFFMLFNRFSIKIRLDSEYLKIMINYSYPIFIFLIAFFFLNYLDRWMINYFYTGEEVGLYSGVFRMTSILSIALLGSRLAFTPVALRHENSGEKFSSLLHFIFFSLLSLSFLLILFAEDITNLFLGNEYSDTYNILPFLLLSKIFLTIYIFSPGLEISRETIKLIYVAFIPFIFGAVISYFMTMHYEITGTAIASCLTSLIYIVLYLKMNENTGKVSYNWKGMAFGIFIFLIFTVLQSYVFNLFINILFLCISLFMIWSLLFDAKEKKTLMDGIHEIKLILTSYTK